MTTLNHINRRTKRPVAMALAVTVGGVAGLLAGQAYAADVPQTYTPAPEPYVQQRVSTSFSNVGPYVGVRGGASFAEDTVFAVTGATVTNEYEDWGLNGSVFAGYGMEFFPGFGGRIEAELGYSTFEIDRHLVAGVAATGPSGDTNAFSGMVNAYVDANVGAFRPFAGVGLGLARLSFDDHNANGALQMDDDDTAFSWQVSGGVGYDLTDRITLEGLVRYQSVMDVELTSAVGGVTSETDLNATSGLVGLRYDF